MKGTVLNPNIKYFKKAPNSEAVERARQRAEKRAVDFRCKIKENINGAETSSSATPSTPTATPSHSQLPPSTPPPSGSQASSCAPSTASQRSPSTGVKTSVKKLHLNRIEERVRRERRNAYILELESIAAELQAKYNIVDFPDEAGGAPVTAARGRSGSSPPSRRSDGRSADAAQSAAPGNGSAQSSAEDSASTLERRKVPGIFRDKHPCKAVQMARNVAHRRAQNFILLRRLSKGSSRMRKEQNHELADLSDFRYDAYIGALEDQVDYLENSGKKLFILASAATEAARTATEEPAKEPPSSPRKKCDVKGGGEAADRRATQPTKEPSACGARRVRAPDERNEGEGEVHARGAAKVARDASCSVRRASTVDGDDMQEEPVYLSPLTQE